MGMHHASALTLMSACRHIEDTAGGGMDRISLRPIAGNNFF